MRSPTLMKDYLNEKINFENINLSRLTTLVQSINESREATIPRIKRKFEETSSNFESVLTLLLQIKLIGIADGKLIINQSVETLNKSQFAEVVVKNLFDNESYSNFQLSEFFGHFIFKNNQYWFLPNRKLRLQTSGVRNFLITLGFLEYSSEVDAYFISEKGNRYFGKVLNKSKITLLQLAKNLANNEELGLAAEKLVFAYEKSRLQGFPKLIMEIKHISQEKVNAGYDIQSFSGNPLFKNPVPRYIEVKAVSLLDHKFYWSRNEMEVAKCLGEEYYLYLVPVKSEGIFSIENLVIIKNPYEKVFNNRLFWESTVELISFSSNQLIKNLQ